MGNVVPLRFRPTIVICAGEEGRAVGGQLATLLPSLDAFRRPGVALLSVAHAGADSADSADGPTGRWLDADALEIAPSGARPGGGAPAREEPAEGGVPLTTLIVEALRGEDPRRPHPAGRPPHAGVLDDATLQRIKAAGYLVPKTAVVVWIAAATASPLIATIAESIRAAAHSEQVECWVLLALTTVYSREPEEHRRQEALSAAQPWQRLLLEQSDGQRLATFAYLFESHAENGAFWEGANDVAFAAAEAIFVLTATGITTTRQFEETLRRSLPHMVEQPFERMSGVGTSRLSFPRAHAEQYCAYRLGAAILREWVPPREVADKQALGEQRQAAATWLASVRARVAEAGAARRGGRRSPQLSAEAFTSPRGEPAAQPDGRLIFSAFSDRQLERHTRAGHDLPDAYARQRARAEEGFEQWTHAIRPHWESFAYTSENTLAETANALLMQGAAGVQLARAYTEELSLSLAEERAQARRRQQTRHTQYCDFLRTMATDADGPWLDGQEHPPATAGAAAPPAVAMPAAAATAQTEPPPATLAELEDGVIATLALRHRWRTEQQPPLAGIVGALLAVVPPAVFVAQAMLPAEWFRGRLGVPLLLLCITALGAAVGFGYAAWRRRQLQEAADDLRAVYRRLMAHRCERHEDLRRVGLLAGLHNRARLVLDRLINWDTFMRVVADEMEHSAARVERDLFEGAIGRRDVLVANRKQLRPYDYSLARFEEDLTRKRVAGATTWHKTHGALLLRLREHLGERFHLVDADAPEIASPIREFCLAVVRPYLEGDLVSLEAALAALPGEGSSDLFDTLIERAVMLYHPGANPRAPRVFVAARDDSHLHIGEKSRAADAITVQVAETEWVAALRLMPGGAVPSFWEREDEQRVREALPPSPIWLRPA